MRLKRCTSAAIDAQRRPGAASGGARRVRSELARSSEWSRDAPKAPQDLSRDQKWRVATKKQLTWKTDRAVKKRHSAVDFADTPAEAEFRTEVRSWLAEHLT